jgi:hypothetical protein
MMDAASRHPAASVLKAVMEANLMNIAKFARSNDKPT